MSVAARTASAKRTGPVTCRRSRSWTSTPAGSGEPVTVDTTGRRGAANGTSASQAANSRSAGRISGEWNACDTTSSAHSRPRAPADAQTRRTASRAPETTVCRGPLYPATTTGSAPISASTTVASAAMPAIVPGSGQRAMAAPRAAAMRSRVAASVQPAQCSAVSSPRLCPTATVAPTPRSSSTRRAASEPVTTRGWATSVRTPSASAGRPAARYTSSAAVKRRRSAPPRVLRPEPWPGNR